MNTERHRLAISAAKTYLEMRDYVIIELYFRRPGSQIDIVASKNNVAYCVEVKLILDLNSSETIEIISSIKLKELRYSAKVWLQESKWHGDYVLSTIEIDNHSFNVLNFLDNAY